MDTSLVIAPSSWCRPLLLHVAVLSLLLTLVLQLQLCALEQVRDATF